MEILYIPNFHIVVTKRFDILLILNIPTSISLSCGVYLCWSRDKMSLLPVKLKRDDGFHLDLEDYLMGLLQLASELVSSYIHTAS